MDINFSNKGFIMPKIYNLTGEDRRKDDQFSFLTMGRRIQSNSYQNGSTTSNNGWVWTNSSIFIINILYLFYLKNAKATRLKSWLIEDIKDINSVGK